MSIVKTWSIISGPLKPKTKLILTEFQGFTLLTPSLVQYIYNLEYHFDIDPSSLLYLLHFIPDLWNRSWPAIVCDLSLPGDAAGPDDHGLVELHEVFAHLEREKKNIFKDCEKNLNWKYTSLVM